MLYPKLESVRAMLFSSVPLLRASRIFMAMSTVVFCAATQAQVIGTGATSVRDLMATWTDQYGGITGGASYEPTGSSVGVSKATEQSVDFGVTDVPLTAAALRQAGLRQVPLAATAVAIMVKAPSRSGTTPKSQRLTPASPCLTCPSCLSGVQMARANRMSFPRISHALTLNGVAPRRQPITSISTLAKACAAVKRWWTWSKRHAVRLATRVLGLPKNRG
jgi:hypothetical protein